ncbi:MAG: hypothetical protein ISR75_02950 [Phycisphaerales bacterium]|nr:hypothetical protein [Planctomycetota bacterium]MBL6997381.1 hypothetical protein [Phycisphaerales bacterium]
MKRTLLLIILTLLLIRCGGITMTNPHSVLNETGRSSSVHIQAMELLDLEVGIENQSYKDKLQRMLWSPGYTNDARMAALHRLWESDREGTIRVIRQRLPRLENWSWLTVLCAWIADENVIELDEALISSWAVPTPMVKGEEERPEYQALVQLVGKDAVVDVIFTSLVESNKTWKQGYRTRCWELLHRLAERNRLTELLNNEMISEDDSFLVDLRKAMNDFGIVPLRREEILWIRELSKPKYQSFWKEAIDALSEINEQRRSRLEMRDIPIAVSLKRHGEPGALSRPTEEIISKVESAISEMHHYFEYEGGGSYDAGSELLKTHKSKLTWGDAIALEIALKALDVQEVRSHLFDFARRDLLDTTTEYGGVIALDNEGRFEILEFEPRVRHHDRRFNASQDMFDAAYTALFHFHFHAQKYRNGDHAGPGMGDKNYASNTRANCLVFTFVNENTINVDYYRHTDVVVDLGTITLD